MVRKRYKNLLQWFVIISVVLIVNMWVGGSASALTYSSETEMEFTFNSIITISISSPNLTISNLAPGEYSDSNIITVGATTNASMGYQLSATVGQKNGTDALVNTVSSSNTFANLTSAKATLANFSDNTWGYSYCADTSTNCSTSGSATWVSGSKGSTTAGYAGLPLDNNDNAEERGLGGVLLLNTSGPEDTIQSVQFKIGAKASNNQASGDYTNTINFYAVANPSSEGHYTVNYYDSVNDGTADFRNMPSSNTGTYGNNQVTISDKYPYDNNGLYDFMGWCDEMPEIDTCYGITYSPGNTISVPEGASEIVIDLYAIWSENSVGQTIVAGVNNGSDATVIVSTSDDEATIDPFGSASFEGSNLSLSINIVPPSECESDWHWDATYYNWDSGELIEESGDGGGSLSFSDLQTDITVDISGYCDDSGSGGGDVGGDG